MLEIIPVTTWIATFLVVLGMAYVIFWVMRRCADSEATIYIPPGVVLTWIQVMDYVVLAGSLMLFLTDYMPAWMFDVVCVAALVSVSLMFYMKRMNRVESPEAQAMLNAAAAELRLKKKAREEAAARAAVHEDIAVQRAQVTLAGKPGVSATEANKPTQKRPSGLPAPYTV